MAVRIVTYNILVPMLAEEPGRYHKCRPEFLDSRYRWRLIRSQLENEMRFNQNTVICLQEVSLTLLPALKSFFSRFNYAFFESLYGTADQDYMGVGMAIPVSMKVISKNFIPIRDYLRETIVGYDRDPRFNPRLQNHGRVMMNRDASNMTNSWDIALMRPNTLICLGLMIQGRPLFIGTYHMPCMFDQPDVMIIHSSAVKDLMYELAQGHPFILAGDFNIKPTEVPYRVLTSPGFAQRIRLPYIGHNPVPYPFKGHQLLRSAYRQKNGVEPNYTNFAKTRGSPTFSGTLDYIFFVGRLAVTDVRKLPNHPVGKSYPDEKHPSDHLMLAASFRLV